MARTLGLAMWPPRPNLAVLPQTPWLLATRMDITIFCFVPSIAASHALFSSSSSALDFAIFISLSLSLEFQAREDQQQQDIKIKIKLVLLTQGGKGKETELVCNGRVCYYYCASIAPFIGFRPSPPPPPSGHSVTSVTPGLGCYSRSVR